MSDPTARLERALNPVVFKDLLTAAVNPTGTGARLLLYALLFAAPLLALAWASTFAHGPWRFAGRPVLLGFCALLGFFHVAVAVPAATAFALERDRSTLESLVISPLGPWRLVLGKLATAVSIGAIGKAAVLPALGVAFALGGADLAFVPRYLALLLAVDVSLAAFALHLGARRREINTKVGWVKAQTSQTQLVMQATVGLSVATSLIPIYAGIFLIPVALQQGVRISELLTDLAPLGALHPLAALVFWGDINLLGMIRVPVWACGIAFHLLLALPLLADSAEGQKTPGTEPGRWTRLLALPFILFTFALAASMAARLEPTARTLVATILPALAILSAAGRSSFSKAPSPTITRRRILEGLLPARALESAPERSLGFTLLVIAVAAPLLLWGAGGGPAAISSLAGLTLTGLALASLGTRATARIGELEDQAFLDALERRGAPETERPEADKDKGKAKRPVLVAWLVSITLGGAGLLALVLGKHGAVPALAPFEPLWQGLLSLGVALNPLGSLLPVLADASVLGTDAVGAFFGGWGLDTNTLFGLHVAAYAVAAAASVLTLKPPLDLDSVMRDREPPPEASPAPEEPPPAAPSDASREPAPASDEAPGEGTTL